MEIHDRGQGFTEFVIRRGERGAPPLRYETLYVSKPSPAELTLLYDAVSQTVRDFRFEGGTLPDFMDGGHATVKLSVGTRSLTAAFGPFRDTAELPSSVQRLMKFADSKIAKHPKAKPTNDA